MLNNAAIEVTEELWRQSNDLNCLTTEWSWIPAVAPDCSGLPRSKVLAHQWILITATWAATKNQQLWNRV